MSDGKNTASGHRLSLTTAPFVPGPLNDRLLHLGFNRIERLNEQLVAGRKDIFNRWEFDCGRQEAPTT